MHPLKNQRLLFFLVLAAAGIALLLLRQSSHRTARHDPLAQLGTAWDGEQVRRVTAAGRSSIEVEGHVPAMVRLDDPAELQLIRQGEPADAGGRAIELSAGTLSFPADGILWGEAGPCLVWRLSGIDPVADPDFGGIEVEVRNRRSGEHNFHVSFSGRTSTVPLVARRSMNYFILPDMSRRPTGSRLDDETLALVFPDLDRKNDVEILSIRILGKTASYAAASTGRAYESLDEETRPVLYQWAGGAAGWDVTVPEEQPALKFGIGLLPNSPPVTFSVSAVDNGGSREVFRGMPGGENVWADQTVDMAAFRGRKIRLVLAAEAESPAVALWSSPRIVQGGRQGRFFFVYLIDALRPDFCEPDSTPAFQALAEGGVRFDKALANGPNTKFSMPALFSGLYPIHTGIMTYDRVSDDVLTLAEAFRQQGFVTASFLFNGNSGRLRGLHQGFDHLFSRERILREARTSGNVDPVDVEAGNSAAMINEFLFDFIRSRQGEDVLIFFHLMDTHSLYLPDEEFLQGFHRAMAAAKLEAPGSRAQLLETLEGWDERRRVRRRGADGRRSPLTAGDLPAEAVLELYRGTVQTADKHFRRFMDFLESEELVSRSTIVLTADHGEHLTEHPELGVFMHTPPMLLEVLRVPLVIRSPGRVPEGVLVSKPVQLADVMPTLLDLAGITYDPARFDGTSLLLLMAGRDGGFFDRRPIVSQSPRQWSVLLKEIHSPDVMGSHGRDVQVFNTAVDPREHAPLTGSAFQPHLDQLAAALARVPRRAVPEAGTIVNEEEVLKQLKALGYIQ